MAGFRSLRDRNAGPPDVDEVLPLVVLPYMRQPLMGWLAETSDGTYGQSAQWQLLCQMLKIDYTSKHAQSAVIDAVNEDNDLLLDLVDARLRARGEVRRYVGQLKTVLALAGSGWRVNDAGDGLEQVIDETVRGISNAAIASANNSAAVHLANAWSDTFGKDRSPTHSHAEMIRAVESAAAPVVTPNDAKATLGTIIGQMEGQSALYTTSGASVTNDGVGAIVSMMKTLWQQQTDRHGSNPTIAATQERVEFLLPIAAALVHAFSNRLVARKN